MYGIQIENLNSECAVGIRICNKPCKLSFRDFKKYVFIQKEYLPAVFGSRL